MQTNGTPNRRSNGTGESSVTAVWISATDIAKRLAVSRSQVSRLAAQARWRKLSVSTTRESRSGGIRYLLQDVEAWESANSF